MNKLSTLSVILICLITMYFGFGQTNCGNSLFYEFSLKKITSKKEKLIEMNFNYKMSESLQESVFGSSILRTEEKPIVKQGLSTHDFIPCGKINEVVTQLKTKPLNEDRTYILLKYSKPIFVSDEKVFLFHEIVMKKDKGSGSKGGANIMEVFLKVNNSWALIDEKILEIY